MKVYIYDYYYWINKIYIREFEVEEKEKTYRSTYGRVFRKEDLDKLEYPSEREMNSLEKSKEKIELFKKLLKENCQENIRVYESKIKELEKRIYDLENAEIVMGDD